MSVGRLGRRGEETSATAAPRSTTTVPDATAEEPIETVPVDPATTVPDRTQTTTVPAAAPPGP